MLTYNKQYHPSVDSVVVAAGKSFFQPKLTINNPNDQYEQEADAVADKVMRIETPSVQKKTDTDSFFSPSPVSITPMQRKCAHCEEEEKMQRKEIKGTIQRQTTPPAEESDIDVRRNPPGEKHDINDPPNLATFDLLDPLNSSVCYEGFCLPSTRSVINGLKKLKNSTGAKPVYNWPLPGLTKEQVRQAACKSIPSLCPPAAGTQTGIPNLTLPPIQLDIPRFQFFDHRIIDHFIFNKYDVPFRHKSLLDKTAIELAANPDLITNIIGHTDVHGGDEYNQALSENRAHAVEQYFLTTNVPSSQIWTVNGMGKQQPRFTNDAVNAASASKNRRVELDIRKLIWNVSFLSAPSHTLQLQRKCAHCEEEKLQRKEIDEKEKNADYNLENYVRGLSGAGQPLPNEARNFYEPRFGYDFSNVKIHSDTVAAKSAQSINALAYTSGNNIVFNSGQYSPNTDKGKRLLGHELTHVVQQNSSIMKKNIQRYSDTDHHIVEEVALRNVFSEKEIKFIEQGNMQRDYSQLPAAAAFLLVPGSGFGEYETHEHFDNFIFDKEKNRWVSHSDYEKFWDDNTKDWVKRAAPLLKKGNPKITPLQYIETELLAAVEKDMPDSNSFIHLGNAFHTVEDFFAHSNFVELTKGDFSSGKELTTHVSGVPGPSSEDSILSNVSDPASAAFYRERSKAKLEKASSLSHGALAKDFHSQRNHALAITLTALVIRQIALLVKNVFALKIKEQRNEYVRNIIMKTLSNYLRPPSDKDKWWEKMLDEDKGNTGRQIKNLQDKTPTTINQLPGSPLRSFEATRFSSWKAIGLGTSVSLQLKDNTFFTAGYMLYAPGTGKSLDDKIFVAPRSGWDQNDKPAIIFGAQISGTFDVTDLLTRKK